MRRKIVFISGPINGKKNYKISFAAAEFRLKERGYIVLNPTVLPDNLPDETYMPICISMLEQADEIYMLSGWANSTGAFAERAYAVRQGKRIKYEENDNDDKD